jgi:hypothetical protein
MNRRFYVGISINPTGEKRRLVVIGATPTRKKYSQDDSKRPYRDSGRGYGTSQRREAYGRGGGRGRGRGQHRGPSTNHRGGAPIPLPIYLQTIRVEVH